MRIAAARRGYAEYAQFQWVWKKRDLVALLLVPAILALLSGCAWPIRDPQKLEAIRAEAQSLIARHRGKLPRGWADIPKRDWPPVIASLEPEFVTVSDRSVDILIKPYLDGGWGYGIARRKRDLGMLEDCWSELIDGVFWHGPC